jgi:tryptophan synthase beta chain
MEIKVQLKESDIPRQWYNLAPDLPTPLLPPLGPDGKPIGPDMLAPVFPMNLIEQEVSPERWMDIPEEILGILYRWRPTPLKRAVYLEKHLKTPARIYYKDESYSPPGSHKPNTSVAQAWYNKQFGIRMQGLYGQNQFRSEALPKDHDAGLGSRLCRKPQYRDKCRP